MNQKSLQEFEFIFNPRTIAVVGASQDKWKFGTRYLQALIDSGFEGGLYPVNPGCKEILGLRSYPKLTSISDKIDYVIVSIPAQFMLELLDECAEKGVKVVQIFAAGFSETGEHQGKMLEAEMVKKANAGGFRIIGPNCIGVYSPAHKVPFGPVYLPADAGSVGFISHSGGVAGHLIDDGVRRGIRFSKVVSFGNGCDLDNCDYLEYLANDPHTKIVGGYLEGARDSRRLFGLIGEISKIKPIVIWKGGRTAAGSQTAASHSGSMAGSDIIWKSAMKQAGAVEVKSHNELVDTILAFFYLSWFQGNRIAVIAGLYGAGGGACVAASDACSSVGLDVPPFKDETRAALKSILPKAGCILRNPLDVGSIGGVLSLLDKSIGLVLADHRMDILIIQVPVDFLLGFESKELFYETIELIVHHKKSQNKQIVVVSPHGSAVVERLEFEERLQDEGIPAYPTFERAAKAIANVNWYFGLHEQKNMR